MPKPHGHHCEQTPAGGQQCVGEERDFGFARRKLRMWSHAVRELCEKLLQCATDVIKPLMHGWHMPRTRREQ